MMHRCSECAKYMSGSRECDAWYVVKGYDRVLENGLIPFKGDCGACVWFEMRDGEEERPTVICSECKWYKRSGEIGSGDAVGLCNCKFLTVFGDVDRECERFEECREENDEELPFTELEEADGGAEEEDVVNHPKHYETGRFECIDAMVETQGVEAVMDYCLCNAFKYLWRHNGKNGDEDVRKAKWYIDKYLALDEQFSRQDRE